MAARAKPIKTGPSKPFRAALDRYLRGNPDLYDKLLDVMAKAALRGSLPHQQELVNRSDGRVPYKMGGDEDGTPIDIIVTGVPRAGRD